MTSPSEPYPIHVIQHRIYRLFAYSFPPVHRDMLSHLQQATFHQYASLNQFFYSATYDKLYICLLDSSLDQNDSIDLAFKLKCSFHYHRLCISRSKFTYSPCHIHPATRIFRSSHLIFSIPLIPQLDRHC